MRKYSNGRSREKCGDKKFEKKIDVAQIYVCRKGNVMGIGIRPRVELDTKPLATIAANTYAYAELQPGKHTMIAKTPEHDSVMDFTVTAGQQMFFQTWIVPGVFAGRGVIDEIRAEDGKACVTNGELVEAVTN
jgi:hypothetical protein